jgi:hypothetical protein
VQNADPVVHVVAQLSQDELKEIVARDLSGYRLADTSPAVDAQSSVRAAPEATTPDIEMLRRKYLGPEATAKGAEVSFGVGGDATTDDSIVAVQPDTTPDPWSRSARPKAVVISGSEKRVIGAQG